MANSSDIVIRLTFYKDACTEMTYDVNTFTKFDEAFMKWSFRNDGVKLHPTLPIYRLIGRWSIHSSLKWTEEIAEINKQMKALGIRYIEADYYDLEVGMDFVTHGTLSFNEVGDVTLDDIIYTSSVEAFAQNTQVVALITEEDEDSDAYNEQLNTMLDQLEDYFIKDLSA